MNPVKHNLTLADGKDLKRILKLFENYAEIMKILNEDSQASSKGGAMMNYEVEIKIKEIWT